MAEKKKASKKKAVTEQADQKKVVADQYEGMFLLPPSFATELEGAQKLVRGIIEKHGGQIIVIKKWDERKLAYEIERQKRGVYILAYFSAPPSSITQYERDVNLNEQVLRVLITKADHLNAEEMAAVEPQPIQVREERNPWDRPGFNDDRGSRGPREDRPREDRPREDRPRAPRAESPEAAVGKE